MRYAQGGGLTPKRQQAREQVRMEAAKRFEAGEKSAGIAADLRVGVRQVEKWRKVWREGCTDAPRSKGPVSVERLSPAQWARLEAALRQGPAMHSWDDEGHTWAPRGCPPTVRVRRSGTGRLTIAGLTCFRPGERPHFFFDLHLYRGRKGEPKSFSWQDYRDLLVRAHHQLGRPLVLVWDNLNVHLVDELADFFEENKAWLRVFQLPGYAPELNPTEGVWSLIKRSLADFAAANLDHLVRVVKRKLKKIQYRPHLLDGCLAETGLVIHPW